MSSVPATTSARAPDGSVGALPRAPWRRTPSPTVALALANARYWPTVAPRVRARLADWEADARAIPDPASREIALGKLERERMNVKAAATLATLAPRKRRGRVVDAIIALQVLYDRLDALDERAAADGQPDDCLEQLVDATGERLMGLPRADAVGQVARAAASRCARAQALVHRAGTLGSGPLRAWARALEPDGPLGWRELLAGAGASVLAVHALIAAAADERTTPERAWAIDRAYLAIGALTMLDSVNDQAEDLADRQVGFVELYDGDRELLARRLAAAAREARARAAALPNAGHHLMTAAGIVAYYASAPGADPRVVAPVRRELEPAITPALVLMRAWRAIGS